MISGLNFVISGERIRRILEKAAAAQTDSPKGRFSLS
jgi:hypothetical protein